MTTPMYVGNYEYEASERELERLFERYGRVRRVDFKSGFCFVYYEDMRDADDAIRDLDGREWGRRRRRLRVEIAKNDSNVRAREEKRRENARPTTTLFVAGFDPHTARNYDLERVFEKFGRIKRCQIKRSYCFVEFYELEDAIDACKELHGARILSRECTVEFCVQEGNRSSRDRSPGPPRERSRYEEDRRRYRSRSTERRSSRRSPSYSRSASPPPRRRASRSPIRHDREEKQRSYPRSRSRSMSPRNGRSEPPSRTRSPMPRSLSP